MFEEEMVLSVEELVSQDKVPITLSENNELTMNYSMESDMIKILIMKELG